MRWAVDKIDSGLYNNNMKTGTIVSISTPIGKGAIAIIRMSGQQSLEIALKLFHAQNLNAQNVVSRFMYFGKLALDEAFEECLMVFFKAPFSYTGENIVEFQVHGGVLLAQKVLDACMAAGARLADPGEFSKRAFLNGKISLDKAEAIIGEINAETEGELKSSLQVTNGRLSEKIQSLQNQLSMLLAEIEVGMDYPDETEEVELKTDVRKKLQEVETEIEVLLKTAQSAKYLKNGINVSLVGKTNVGKSSVMNALLGESRAIVTDIQGTTRDNITASFLHNKIKINLEDTAGIRETEDVVESIGIEKSKKSLVQADVVLFVLDGSEKFDEEDGEIEKLLQGKNTIVVINKADKKRAVKKFENEIEVSALCGQNIQKLKDQIVDMVFQEKIDANALVLSNQRHCTVLEEAKRFLHAALESEAYGLEILSMQIKKVWQTLGKITGNTENEDIINLIFSKFCLGK